jgi:AcrR family transcriptional regulator
MGDADAFLPAPGRGQYDRRQTREQRLSEQRDRLVAATARAFALYAAPSVAQVIEIGGVGRGTFYEYFDDVEHARVAAVRAVERWMEQELVAAEARSRTPVERFRALAAAWLELAEREPAGALVALRIDAVGRAVSSPLGAVLERALARSLDALTRTGMMRGERDALRTLAFVASAEALARGVANGALGVEQPGAPVERAAAERALVDVSVRLLR